MSDLLEALGDEIADPEEGNFEGHNPRAKTLSTLTWWSQRFSLSSRSRCVTMTLAS